jgi:recombination protein RecR
MQPFPPAFQELADELGSLPGVGAKTAQRLAFHLLKAGPGRAQALATALQGLHARLGLCQECGMLCEGARCQVCTDPSRDAGLICVVEEPQDLAALERGGSFRGRYHLLMGSLSPLNGVGPDELRIRPLLDRVSAGGVREVILATNADVEGEATALYLARLLKPLGLTVTRLATGLPMGGDLEYLDDLTLTRALQGRREL